MKNTKRLSRIAAITLAIVAMAVSLTGCSNPADGTTPTNQTGSGGGQGGNGEDTTPTFTSISEFKTYLAGKPTNTASTSYRVKLNIKDEDMAALKTLLLATDKYVYLDLSGSTITEIPYFAFINMEEVSEESFIGCAALAGIIIPNSVTIIGDGAFAMCTGLTSVIFDGTITVGNFDSGAFGESGMEYGYYIDDLRDKYLAGGTGTYTTTAPAGENSAWTKQ